MSVENTSERPSRWPLRRSGSVLEVDGARFVGGATEETGVSPTHASRALDGEWEGQRTTRSNGSSESETSSRAEVATIVQSGRAVPAYVAARIGRRMPQRTLVIPGIASDEKSSDLSVSTAAALPLPEPSTVPAVAVSATEAAFRSWWAILIPVLLLPLAVLLLVHREPAYEAVAVVWVTRLSSLDSSALGSNSNPLDTAADTQSQVLNDLLATRSFSLAVAERAGMDHATAWADVQDWVTVTSEGVNILEVSAITASGELSKALVDGVINEYRAGVTAESDRETNIAIDYYDAQIVVAKAELARRNAAFATYLLTNPEQPGTHLTYIALSDAVASQSVTIEELESSLDNVRRLAATTEQSLDAQFNVRDPALLPESAVPQSLWARFGLVAGAVAFGLIIAAGYVYTIFRTDRAIRSKEEILELGVPVVGVVPALGKSFGWLPRRPATPTLWRWRSNRTRREAATL